MTRKSKREIENELDDLEPDDGDVPPDVGAIEQYFTDKYPDPSNTELGDAWRSALKPDNDTEE